MNKLRILVALGLSAVASTAVAAPTDTRVAARALAAAPAADRDGPVLDVPGARGYVATTDVPLPPGGTFSGIQWEQAGPSIPQSAIEGTLEYNAACQWLRAWRDGREREQAVQVLQQAPDWPAVRVLGSKPFLTRVAADVAAGGGETASNMLLDCDASHVREVAYALSRGLPPSR